MSPRNDYANHFVPVDPNTFGGQLRDLRIAAGMSQGELGAAIGSNQKVISTYELNKVIPREEIIIALADVLNVSPARFFEATRFRDVLIVGPERRKRLSQLREQDWQRFDRMLDRLTDATPDERAKFERTLDRLLKEWES